MGAFAATLALGLLAGLLSGMFGIGGGIITTPAIRLLLGRPELVAVGTPLVAIAPAAVAGAWTYRRAHLVDIGLGLRVGAWGVLAGSVGALASPLVGGRALMLATAVLLVFVAYRMLPRARQGARDIEPDAESRRRRTRGWRPAAVGLAAGGYAGLLGLGGGLLIVPLLTAWLGVRVKVAMATSLVAIAVIATPAAAVHFALGHIDAELGLMLALGVVPGAAIGARCTVAAREPALRLAFSGVLGASGVVLALNEWGVGLGRG